MKKIMLIVVCFIYSNDLICQTYNTPDVEIYNVTGPPPKYDYGMAENSVFISPISPNIIVSANNAHNKFGLPYEDNLSVFVSDNFGVAGSWVGNFFFQSDGWADPSCSIDMYGRIYISYIPNDPIFGNNLVSLRYSDDNGLNWSTPPRLLFLAMMLISHFYTLIIVQIARVI